MFAAAVLGCSLVAIALASNPAQRLPIVTVCVLVIAILLAVLQISALMASQARYERALGRDITLRKQTEEALRGSQDFLSRTGQVAGVGGWDLDLRTNRVQWSEHVRRIHEVSDDYMPTLESAVSFYTPESRAVIAGAVEEARETGRSWDLELPLRTASGRLIFVRAVGEAEFDEQGRAVRLVGALQDITQRKKLEQRLESNERFIRAITDNVPVRLAYFDQEQRIQFANQALCDRFGQTREALIGRRVSELPGRRADSLLARKLTAALKGERQRVEYPDVMGGEPRVMETHYVPDVDQDGTVRGVFGVGLDITHLKSVERDLRDLTDVFDSTTDYIAQTDASGQMLYINPSARRAFGIALDAAVTGRSYKEFFTPETNERWSREILPTAQRDGVWIGEAAIILAGGIVAPVSHMIIAHHDASRRVLRYSAVMRNIASEVSAREELARQTATLNAVVEADPAILAVWDVDMHFRVVNRAFERWLGRSREAVIGRTIEEVLGTAEYEVCKPWIARALGGETVSFEKEYPDSALLRHLAVTYLPLRLSDGTIAGFIGIAQDITSQREENIRLRALSEQDPLTGLLNRAGFNAYLNEKISQGESHYLAVLYVDLDHFKSINDRHGHAVGDRVLQEFSSRLLKLSRPTDAVARLGGDEFGIVIPGVRETAHAAAIAAKVVESAGVAMRIGDLELVIGASVGVALNADRAGGWHALVEDADRMVYQAKAAGRAQYKLSASALPDEQPTRASSDPGCG